MVYTFEVETLFISDLIHGRSKALQTISSEVDVLKIKIKAQQITAKVSAEDITQWDTSIDGKIEAADDEIT